MSADQGDRSAAAESGFGGWSLTLGRALVLLIGFALAAAMFAISAWMNYRFGQTLGVEPTDRALYGGASLAADGLKSVIPFLLIGLWRARRWLLVGAGATLWLLCVAWSLASAVGFAAATREAATATRAAALAETAALGERAARLERLIAGLPAHRPAAAVAAEIDAAAVPRDVWRRTDRCRDVTRPDSLAVCQPVLELRRELAVAEDAARLETDLAATRAALAERPVAGVTADPQAAAIAALFGGEASGVRQTLALVMTGLIELGASIGFTLVALGAGALQGGRSASKRAPPDPAEPAPRRAAGAAPSSPRAAALLAPALPPRPALPQITDQRDRAPAPEDGDRLAAAPETGARREPERAAEAEPEPQEADRATADVRSMDIDDEYFNQDR
ncbi:MAG: hypothetical protein AAGM38_11915 [Pseudomonadota bacterium]